MHVDRLLNKQKERIQKFRETGDSTYTYRNELDNPTFQHLMIHNKYTDLARRTA